MGILSNRQKLTKPRGCVHATATAGKLAGGLGLGGAQPNTGMAQHQHGHHLCPMPGRCNGLPGNQFCYNSGFQPKKKMEGALH